ncbi:hypothetical protein [Amycolatopsis sp. H20-H5]|nr:hypothetical protein [Amycolatopsis sp. H20-H5]MEC3976051.1 hypothetical protein [Amycolatopsis sp. H20-H5]
MGQLAGKDFIGEATWSSFVSATGARNDDVFAEMEQKSQEVLVKK